MPRPSQNTDQKLIEAARGMLKTSGLTGLNLRQVAKKAGVNLGMFHYHFRTKEAFARRVLQETYEMFFKEFSLETSGDGEALGKLKAALTTLAFFVRDNRRLALGLIHDVLNKDRVVLDFAKANGPRHGLVILGLVRRCQREGTLRKMKLPAIMPQIMGSTLFPLVALALLEHLEVKRLRFIPLAAVKAAVSSDRAIRERVDLVLDSLAPRKGSAK